MVNINIKKNKTENIHQHLLDYCKEYYITFLRESDNKKLHDRYKKLVTEKDKQNAIAKFVNMNINRIHILLHTLFQPELNKGCIWTEKYFLQQSSRLQQDILSNLYREFFLKFAYKTKLIERNNTKSYVSPNAGLSYTKCYEYRLPPRLYADDQIWEEEEIEITDRLAQSIKNKNKAKYQKKNKRPKPSEYGLKLFEHLDNWKLDTEAVPDHLQDAFKKYLDLDFYTDNHWKEKRYYHPIIMMDKRLRYLLFFNEPNEEHQIVEISNSHQFFFATWLTQEMEAKDKQLSQINSIGQALQIVAKTQKKKVICNIARAIKSKTLQQFYRQLEYNFETDFDTNLIEFEDEYRRQLTLYVIMSVAGLTYDVLMKLSNTDKTRGEFKKEVNTVLNKHTDSNWKPYGVDGLFMDYFIEIYKIIMKFKQTHYTNFGHRMNQWESDFVRPFCEELLLNDIPFIPIHDGIFISKKKSLELLTDMRNQSKNKFGITAPIKLESVD